MWSRAPRIASRTDPRTLKRALYVAHRTVSRTLKHALYTAHSHPHLALRRTSHLALLTFYFVLRTSYFALCCILAHESLSVTVRLKTGDPGRESGSMQK